MAGQPKQDDSAIRRRTAVGTEQPAGDARLSAALRARLAELEERQRALCAALAERESRLGQYRDLFEEAPVGYCVLDADARVVQANKAVAEMLGLPASSLVGRPLRDLVHDADHARLEHLLGSLPDRPGAPALALRLLGPAGRLVHAWLRVGAILDPGRAGGCRVVITEGAVGQGDSPGFPDSDMRLRDLADGLPDAVVYQLTALPDGSRRFTYVSRGVERINEVTVDEVLANADAIYGQVLPEWRQVVQDREEEALRNLETMRVEVQSRLPSGRLRWFEYSSRPRQIPGGPLVWDGVQVDITRIKEAEAERSRLQAELIEAQRLESVGRLAGGVAHEFNNMLLVILGYAQMAMEQVDPGGALHADLGQILTAAQRSKETVRQLLTFARKQVITPDVCDLNTGIEGMITMLRHLVGERIDLAWRPAPDLWPVRIDVSQLNQILVNLCLNSRDAIDGAGRIAIGTERLSLDEAQCAEYPDCLPGDYVVLTVNDTGCGMDEATMGNLFEPFFTTKPVGKGTGLGLSTVYGIVKQSNGFIAVSSDPGTGTLFRIHLPRHVGSVSPSPPATAEGTPVARGETVLLVEDEAGVLGVLAGMLGGLGYTVLAAPTPGEALRLVARHDGAIHLLVTDVIMPEMNGRDLARRMLRMLPELAVLFISGHTGAVIGQSGAMDEGMHYLLKPFSKEEVARKVRLVLDEVAGPAAG